MSYFDVKAVSNSSLSYIDPESGGNPRLFRKFLDGQLEDKPSKSFEIGTLIHEELLEPGKLDIVPAETPGPKTQEIIDALWHRLYQDVEDGSAEELNLDTLTEETWNAVIPADFYPKYTLQTKINRIVRDGGTYWKALYTTRGKKIVDPATWHIVQGCIESIKMHEVAEQLICKNGFGQFHEAHAEKEIFFEIPWAAPEENEVMIPVKAKIDRFLIDHQEKRITLVDLKTTSKPLGRFEETVAIYRYYRQLAWYRMCLAHEYPDYKVDECYIVAVQTNKEYPCDVFKIDESYLNAGIREYEGHLDRIAFHLARANWGNSMETQLGCIHNLVLPDDSSNV